MLTGARTKGFGVLLEMGRNVLIVHISGISDPSWPEESVLFVFDRNAVVRVELVAKSRW